MVSITLSVPEDVKEKMNKFDEINWSGFIRKCITEKAEELTWKEDMFNKLKNEREIVDWSVKLARHGRKGRFEDLKTKGFAK